MNCPLIDVPTLAACDPRSVLIVDCRFDLADPDKGRLGYLQEHIPGAVYASLDDDLSDRAKISLGLGRHPMPDTDDFARTLSRWGWTPEQQLVAYDTAAGAMAARLWWMMRAINANVAVLDGGLDAWRTAGLAMQAGEVVRPPSAVQVHFDPSRSLDSAALCAAVDAHDIILVDARAAPRYRGEVEPLDRVGGHVPGARNRPFTENLTADGHFRPAADLRKDFDRLLQGRNAGDCVHMCGSGVTACHNLLAMAHAGLYNARLYAPSWSGWISDPARPVAKGEE